MTIFSNARLGFFLLVSLLLLSCSGTGPADLGVANARLMPCPASPNCVSSDDLDGEHRVAPLRLNLSPDAGWELARALVVAWPRAKILVESDDYLHAECRSALFGFVDDLELHLRPADGVIALRSASRLGYSDFGVNRGRVEALRAALVSQGAIR